MQIDTDGRNPSVTQYIVRGVIFFLVLAMIFVLLTMRYKGVFEDKVPVTAEMTDVGDGLISNADVRYNGLIVGAVTSIALSEETGEGNERLKSVQIDLEPGQADGIPANVTARTVPSNLFGVNSVELVQPASPSSDHLTDDATIPADKSLSTLKLQDAQNQLRALLQAVPPEELAAVLGTLATALQGGETFGSFVSVLDQYFATINAQFPPGAPSGFADFNASVNGLAQSAPQLLDALGKSVIPAMTVAENQANLTALLSASQGLLDTTQALFAQNGNGGQRVVNDLNRVVGAAVLEPGALPEALTALNNLAARVLTVFTGVNGHPQLNLGVSFGAFQRYTRQNCPVYNGGPYGQLRGPGCTGPGTGTGPTSSGPLQIYPSDGMRRNAAGSVSTSSDNKTLGEALQRKPSTADTLMLGPLVQSVAPRGESGQNQNQNGGGR